MKRLPFHPSIWFACSLFTLCVMVGFASTQAAEKKPSPVEIALETPVHDFTVTNAALAKVLDQLNTVSLVPIHAELRTHPGVFSFALTNTNLREVLGQVAARFEAKIIDSTNCLNLVWNEKVAAADYPLNLKLKQFKTDAATKEAAAQAVFKLPEFIERKFYIIFLQARRNTAGQKDFPLEFDDVRPRDVLNIVAERAGKTYWALVLEGNNHYFSFGSHQYGSGRTGRE